MDAAMGGDEQPIFDGEEAMLEQLKAMGMPPKMLNNLTSTQKKTMFEMTQRQDIVERAQRLANINDDGSKAEWKQEPKYRWRDDGQSHVYLEVPCDSGEITCQIEEASLSAACATDILVAGNLFQKVMPAESKWELQEDGKIIKIVLKKASPMRWLMVIR